MTDVAEWIATEGSRIMLIYGEFDPWTARAIDLGDAEDSDVFVAPRASHSTQLASLTAEDRRMAGEVLRDWTGVTVSLVRALGDDARPTMARRPRLQSGDL